MTLRASTWGVSERQFWLHGRLPERLVEYDPDLDGWNVYGHPETVRVASDSDSFSSDVDRILPEHMRMRSEGLLGKEDPPAHTRLRNFVRNAFTPKVVADLEPRIAELTNELLDTVADQDRLELVADLAHPLPVTVIAELLGLPESDRGLVMHWGEEMLRVTATSLVDKSEEQARAMEATRVLVDDLTAYLGEHVAERRRRPREDLLTRLVEAEVDGERLTTEQIRNLSRALLIAGHLTTTMLLGNTVLCLDAHPRHLARARADGSALPPIIEESLRLLSPSVALRRVTTRDVEIGGVTVPANRLVKAWIAVANRDPRVFPDPEAFDPARDPNPHLAFSRGAHFCLGAPLARLEGRVALGVLLARFPNLRIDPERPPEFIPNPGVIGLRKLPLLLTPS
ncbi:cytochrome P450 [Actinomadura terrae]|uniref:cytochrome P450 n=1 Tax=Actinomadura terrae TaxID=604353 RepID=UPI001FA79A35|nr:cytochrome P450 [Actinomadura terrae]